MDKVPRFFIGAKNVVVVVAVTSQIVEDENPTMKSLKAENENLLSELSDLPRRIEEHDKLNGSRIESEVNTLRTEKKNLEELVVKIRNEQQQKADSSSTDVVKQLKAEKCELERKVASLSSELERKQHLAGSDADAELSTLRDEKRRLESLVSHLETEVQQHKDTAHEQRIRALDLKHELREVRFTCLYAFCHCLFSNTTTISVFRGTIHYKMPSDSFHLIIFQIFISYIS